MKITGIICEYNPFHLGHAKQINTIRQQDPDGGIVCLMSGNFVQRGAPAVFDKILRAQTAIMCGADLVLELPVTAALSSAEGFAAEGVRILSSLCDSLSFGAENANETALLETAEVLLSPEFSGKLKEALATGCSFPAARQKALEDLGLDTELIAKPNNILAVEYCKAILSQKIQMKPMPIHRAGDYNDTVARQVDPSATAIRLLIENGESWLPFIPAEAASVFESAPVHCLSAGEKPMLYRLRTMSDEAFEALPYGSEGLWRKLMKNARAFATLEQILTATKSKRYTRSRIDRMVMCAFLGLTQDDIATPAPYVRVLGFNDTGRRILSCAKKTGDFRNLGEVSDHPYQQIENRCDDLYGLFCRSTPEAPGQTKCRRVYYTNRKDML